MKISVDQWLCAGHGLCEAVAPEVFMVNDEGLAEVIEESPGESLLPSAREAARACPAAAILLDETS